VLWISILLFLIQIFRGSLWPFLALVIIITAHRPWPLVAHLQPDPLWDKHPHTFAMASILRKRVVTSATPDDHLLLDKKIADQDPCHCSCHGPQKPSLSSLPPEIHLLISKNLMYPDALSLKHTNRYFYNMVDTGVRLKVEWLMWRRSLHLECPNNTRCDLGSDLRFCRGSMRYISPFVS
jgi:hypothetical protein